MASAGAAAWITPPGAAAWITPPGAAAWITPPGAAAWITPLGAAAWITPPGAAAWGQAARRRSTGMIRTSAATSSFIIASVCSGPGVKRKRSCPRATVG